MAHTKQRYAGNTERNTSAPNSINCKWIGLTLCEDQSKPCEENSPEDGVDALVIGDRLVFCYAVAMWSPKYCEPIGVTSHEVPLGVRPIA